MFVQKTEGEDCFEPAGVGSVFDVFFELFALGQHCVVEEYYVDYAEG